MVDLRQKTPLLIGWSLVLCLGIPSWAQGFKVYISTDMEGCSGVTCSEQVAGEELDLLVGGPGIGPLQDAGGGRGRRPREPQRVGLQ